MNVRKFLPGLLTVRLLKSSNSRKVWGVAGGMMSGEAAPWIATAVFSDTVELDRWEPTLKVLGEEVVAQTLYPAEMFLKNKNAVGDFRI